MPLNANQTIVVRNLFSKPEDDIEAEISTTLVGCSVHNRTVASATAKGLASASIAQIRIFAGGHTLAATQRARAALVSADGKFVDPQQWDALAAVSAADAWTLRPGDKIEVAGTPMTILAVHDNRQGRHNPHWYVEAH